MSILIDKDKKVMVQGITGREGRTRAELMMDYGTNIVAGCTPGKGGGEVHGVPVYDTVEEAREEQGSIDVSVVFVPAPLVKNAALEAVSAGVKLVVLVPDRVPMYDVLEISEATEKSDADFLGPNTLGCLSAGEAVLGMMGGKASSAKDWFKKGNVGVTSRSGGITSSIAYYLSRAGVGISSMVHVGGDPVIGLPHPETVKRFQEDDETEAVVMFGEIGTSQEERVAEMIDRDEFTKPLIAHIGGAAAKEGTRFSHAGAIVEGDKGTHEGKVNCLKEAGAYIAESFDDIPRVTKEALDREGIEY